MKFEFPNHAVMPTKDSSFCSIGYYKKIIYNIFNIKVNEMKLSKNFALWEFAKSQTADRNGIDNFPPLVVQDNLKKLCVNVLQIIRDVTGKSVDVKSGFRCEELEKIIAKSGFVRWAEKRGYEKLPYNTVAWDAYFKRKSHPKGEAADIEIKGMDNKELYELIKNSDIEYDQLILEYYKKGVPSSGWIHISYREGNNRMQAFSRG